MEQIITHRVFHVNTLRVGHISRSVNNRCMEETFAQRLRRLRKTRGLTQEQLAHACGYAGQSRIANYEAEGPHARTPSIDEIPLLAQALGVPDSDLVASLPDTPPTPGGVSPEISEIHMVVGLLAQALAGSIRPAAVDFLEAMDRKFGPLRPGTFARDVVDSVRSELDSQVDISHHARTAHKPRAQKHR